MWVWSNALPFIWWCKHLLRLHLDILFSIIAHLITVSWLHCLTSFIFNFRTTDLSNSHIKERRITYFAVIEWSAIQTRCYRNLFLQLQLIATVCWGMYLSEFLLWGRLSTRGDQPNSKLFHSHIYASLCCEVKQHRAWLVIGLEPIGGMPDHGSQLSLPSLQGQRTTTSFSWEFKKCVAVVIFNRIIFWPHNHAYEQLLKQ